MARLSARSRERAEREGFEPSVGCYPYTRLAGVRLRPLGHLSIPVDDAIYPTTARVTSDDTIRAQT